MLLYIKRGLLLGLVGVLSACSLDYVNPNAATEDQVLTTRDGLIALAIGMQQVFQTSAYGPTVLTPSVTTRETAIMTTFANLEELEIGGAGLSGENGYTNRIFSRLTRVKGMAENLIDAVPNVTLEAGTASGLQAWGHWYRAMCLGHLAHNYEMVPLENSLNNDARYSSAQAAYEEAILLLDQAIDLIQSTPVSTTFSSQVLGNNIDFLNVMRAFKARYELMAGDYTSAISTASAVDLNSASFYIYDAQNFNPIYEGFFEGTVSYAPRDNLGLPDELAPEEGDLRYPFLVNPTDTLSLNNLPIELIAAPWFTSSSAMIPIYRPGEMLLIIAEAHARSGNVAPAEDALNELRQKCPEDSPLGFGACLDDFDSGGDLDALLDEIYKQRRIECYLTGTSLADSRRFNREGPVPGVDLTTERNRNFYPYPDEERSNNTNTPANPPL